MLEEFIGLTCLFDVLILLLWLLGELLLPSDEGCTVAGRALLPSPGGRRAVAGVGVWELQ